MGSFRITAQQPGMSLVIQDSPAPHVSDVPQSMPSSDPLPPEYPLDALLNTTSTPSRSTHYLKRLTPRITGHTLGSDSIQLEVGYQSKAPLILTSAQDPGIIESLKTLSTPRTHPQGLADKTWLAGTVIKPDESFAVRMGLASVVDLHHSKHTENDLRKLPSAIRTGVYTGINVQTGPVASSMVMDTALGQARIGTGMAVSLAESVTVGISYLNQTGLASQKKDNSLRIGAEFISQQDTVFGVNVTQSLQTTHLHQAAVGLYLNSRFR